MRSDALIDPTGTYRYALYREWDRTLRRVSFMMLNPSTADAHGNDPTSRRCIDYAKRWGYGSLSVVNLFAYRATDPDELKDIDRETAIGPENLNHIGNELGRADLIVAAWGEKAVIHQRHLDEEISLMTRTNPMVCLGLSKSGHPFHPLYRPANAELIPYVHSFPRSVDPRDRALNTPER